MANQLVLVVDQAEARIFSCRGYPAKLNLLAELDNSEGRLKEGDLVSDVQGRTFEGPGLPKSAYEPPVSAKETSVIRFLRDVVSQLKKICNGKQRDLVVIAGPRVLGWIRPELVNLSGVKVVREIHKDLSEQSPKEIENYLQPNY